jgi:glycosyltransferase involved in cell wall biosynthesis
MSRVTATIVPSGPLVLAPGPGQQTVDVEIAIPVYNEKRALEGSVRRLHGFLSRSFPVSWRLVVVDNGSTDGTMAVARRLSYELAGVETIGLREPGRGRALRAAWLASQARVLGYMDVDLSTDLRALLPLVAPLLSGHSDVAIGTRLHRAARVQRSLKREAISRSYNRLLRVVLRAGFSDAQCGFKAIRADVAGELVPLVRDQQWFFDTELLILAQRRGMRIHEIPVDWVEDRDSRVHLVSTALADVRGMARLFLHRSCAAPTPVSPQQPILAR